MFVWSSPLLPVSSLVCFLCFSGMARRKVEVHSFCWYHTSLLCFLSVCLIVWDGRRSLGRQGMDCTLSVSLLTPRCGLSSWEHRGLGFICFGLNCVDFEGDRGSSQEVHKHKGNLNQKTTEHKTGAYCPKRCQFPGRQLQQTGEGGFGDRRSWWEWLVSITDVFTIGDSHMSGPHHVSGELELTKEHVVITCVWAKS